MLTNVLLKRNVSNLFLKISSNWEFFNSRGKEFHNFGAQTENAWSPYVFKLQKATESRFDEDDLSLRVGE